MYNNLPRICSAALYRINLFLYICSYSKHKLFSILPLSVNVKSVLAVLRSDGAVVFITLMLGDDCCIFHITINNAPGAVFPLVGPARGSDASDPQDPAVLCAESRGSAGPR